MSWDCVKIGDCCEITSSKRIFFSEYVESGVPFYRSKEIIESSNGQTISEPLFISQEKYDVIKKNFGVPQPGDMLLTSVGTIGVPYVVKEGDHFYFKDGNLTWFRNFNGKLLPQYLYYWVRSAEGQGVLNNTTIGSSQKALTIASLKGLEIPCPPVDVQYRIVEILSGYDDLIENNQKQIKLLEEAAQRQYKEWFVDLRFPGHETTPISDGIPEGWTERSIADVCIRIGAGGTPSRSNGTYWKPSTIKWFKTGELMDCWLLDSSEKISEEGLSHSSAKLFPPNTILMAIYASPTLGRLGILTTEAACNQAALCLVANGSLISWQWLYQKLYELRDEFNAVAKGAGQQNISADVVKKKVIIIPNKECIDRYTSIVAPMFDVIRTLQEQNVQLQEARDRLLPKLMNGEIEV